MIVPEKEPNFQREGEMWFISQMDILTMLSVKDGKYLDPTKLLEEQRLKPKTLFYRGRKYQINDWFLLEKEGENDSLLAILLTKKEMWVVRRNPQAYPVRKMVSEKEPKFIYAESWSVLNKMRIKDFLKLVELGGNGKFPLLGTPFSIRF